MLMIENVVTCRVKDWLRPHVKPRRFHAFGIGGPKTGTHSLAGVFGRYRAWHEPLMEQFMQLIMARATGGLSDSAARDQLRRLDRRMWLELNASYINSFLCDLLLDEHPRAKFILTIRDCYSWVDSVFNHLIGRAHGELQMQFHRWYLDSLSPGSHHRGEQVLERHGIWPLDVWLRAWNLQNRRILELIPSERLLVVRTQDISGDIPRLADFLCIPAHTLDADRSHEYKAKAKLGLLYQIDPDYLRTCVEERCGDLMKRFFPEIQGLSDVPGYRPQDAASPADAT